MAKTNTFIFKDIEGCNLYIKIYLTLWHQIYLEKIKHKHEKKVKRERSLWTFLEEEGTTNFVTRNFGVDALYFHKLYVLAKKIKLREEGGKIIESEIVGVNREVLTAVFDYLAFEQDSTLNERIKLFQEKYPSKGNETNGDWLMRSNHDGKLADLIGYTGKENVRIIIRSWDIAPKNLDNEKTNRHDKYTAKIIMDILKTEKVPHTYEEVYTNEKGDRRESEYDPYQVIEINDNDIFIVIGLYGYNIIPEATDKTENSPFFKSLFFKWEDPANTTEITSILFNSVRRYSAVYTNLEEQKGGISHGIFSKIKYKNYTHILCGGVGQHGTREMGNFLKSKKHIFYETVFEKSSQPHSFAILLELNLDNSAKSKILDSVVLTVQ